MSAKAYSCIQPGCPNKTHGAYCEPCAAAKLGAAAPEECPHGVPLTCPEPRCRRCFVWQNSDAGKLGAARCRIKALESELSRARKKLDDALAEQTE